VTLQAEPFNAHVDHKFASFRELKSKPEERLVRNQNLAN
jgi:hypothetical protein